jgi:hypothetical protein
LLDNNFPEDDKDSDDSTFYCDDTSHDSDGHWVGLTQVISNIFYQAKSKEWMMTVKTTTYILEIMHPGEDENETETDSETKLKPIC